MDGINQPGLDYYNNLIDALLTNGIEPMVTLFHWDLPLKLQEDFGGFDSPEIVEHFNDFADLAFASFGDRVQKWMTFNEVSLRTTFGNTIDSTRYMFTFKPHSYCWQGHDVGAFPPGYGDATGFNFYKCAHNMILAHGKAYRTYEATYKSEQNGEISITLNAFWGEPRDESSEDDILASQVSRNLKYS